MYRRAVLGIITTLVSVTILAAVGFYAYSWGIAQGAMQNAQIIVPEGGAVPAAIYPYRFGPGFGPWGVGFSPLGCLFPILGFFLLFALFRLVFWRGDWGGPGWSGRHGLEEWHRRAHGEAPPAQQSE